ncbi:hypothetical protein [Helicobacter brantae]|uniref:Uncharacterized protein n=1 Tax=Helicobacter brantae TaxID=375927 RepID=A0A3D8J2N6_9HELI|nr:hypothetical protein [Helicobacter brantae]RDU71758.1 hypothetical protein CQA58_01585 [Helicobacter brantae]
MKINKREDLAEYIVKNLVYMSIFVIGVVYLFSGVILNKVNDYKEKREDLRYTRLAYLKAFDQNTGLEKTIQNSQEKNKKFIDLLNNPPSNAMIHAIAQEFFEVTSIKKINAEISGIFINQILEIKGTSTTPQAFFDFSKKIREAYPTITLSLPFSIEKKDLLSDTLELTLYVKITQIQQKN